MTRTLVPEKFKMLFSLHAMAILGLMGLMIILVIRTPFSESLWLDEAITSWLTGRELSEILIDASRLQAQSPLGFLLFWCWAKLFGSSEIALRSLSLISSVVTLTCLGFLGIWFSHYFAQRDGPTDEYSNESHHPHKSTKRPKGSFLLSALLPIIFLLSNENFLRLAWTARPYALGLAAFMASLVMLTRWCSSRRLSDGVGSFTLLIIAFYLHYLLVLGSIIHTLILLRPSNPKVSLKNFALLCLAFTFLCAPGLYHTYTWSKYRDVWNFLPTINISSTLQALLPRQWFVYLPVAAIITWISAFPDRPFRKMNSISPIIGWCLIPTLALILLSLLFNQSFIGNRYLLAKEPGLALFVTVLFFSIAHERGQKLFLSSWLLLCCGFEFNRQWHIENWRQVASYLNQLPTGTPILLNSGLAEIKSNAWLKAVENFPAAEEYITAPLKTYGVTKSIYPVRSPLPDDLEIGDTSPYINRYRIEEAVSLINAHAEGMSTSPIILVTTNQKKATPLSDSELILNRLESQGFASKLEADFGQIRLYSIKNPRLSLR